FHNGLEEEFFQPGFSFQKIVRDPYRIAYCGHPTKGLDASIGILNLLRKREKRFHLHVFGGNGLYGAKDVEMDEKEGVTFRGTIGQLPLARELQRCTFDLHLQERLEPFGITLIEAMRAGCVALASPVGAYPEIVQNGRDGFLIPGNCLSPETQQMAADLILELDRRPEWIKYIRSNAVKTPLNWDILAQAWAGHWEWMLKDQTRLPPLSHLSVCKQCGEYSWLPLADGYHCTHCGFYERVL
ncbi:MAG: glycosyltransferase family 4 protein, partial [Syntrophothermus sp.]